ncbi:ankyrin repeat domain-containing protein, partial [Dethiosulfovibrio salsuginis]
AAAHNENPEIIATLIKAGADIEAKKTSDETPLHEAAAWNENPEIVATLIKAGADIEAKDTSDETLLHRAAAHNENPEIIAMLIEAGADIEAKNIYKGTPLHVAAAHNENPEIVATLIKAGADIEAKDTFDRNPLHEAARWNENPEIIAMLIEAGADVNAKSYDGKKPLYGAKENENRDKSKTISIINIINKNNNLIKKTRALFTEKNSIPTKTRFKLISINILVAICIGLTIDYIPSFLKGILSLLILSHLAYQVTMINIKYISEKSTTTKRRLASMGIDFILLFFVAIVSDYIPESIETVMAFIISVHFIYQLFAIIIGFFKKKLKK